MQQLLEDAQLAISVAPVGRALSWQRALVDAGPEERAEWGERLGLARGAAPRARQGGGMDPPAPSRGRPWARHDHLRGDVRPGRRDRIGQPGAGLPGHRRPFEVVEAAVAAIRAGVNQYPPGPGIPAAQPSPFTGSASPGCVRPRDRGPRHHRRHGGHRGRLLALSTRATTSSSSSRTTTPTSRTSASREAYGGRSRCGPRRTPSTGRAAPGGHAAHPGHAAQHAAQPDGCGAVTSRARAPLPSSPSSTTSSSSRTRSTST